jgi:hypothetical protein
VVDTADNLAEQAVQGAIPAALGGLVDSPSWQYRLVFNETTFGHWLLHATVDRSRASYPGQVRHGRTESCTRPTSAGR